MANAHEEINREPKNRIDNYQTITISQSGSLFYSVTNEIIQGYNFHSELFDDLKHVDPIVTTMKYNNNRIFTYFL